MLIRFFWRNCDLCDDDALWVEATKAEAESIIFPRLSVDEISKSKQLSKQTERIDKSMGKANQTFCFLMSKDISFIRPFPVHFPVHNLWNGYSPFEEMLEINAKNLDAICNIELPE